MIENRYNVTIVIVTYESKNTIGSTLDALKAAYDKWIASVVVIDNMSMDSTVDFIRGNYPWVILERNTKNDGFGRGCNFGAKHAKTPYLMFLNPDAVIELKSLKILLEFMDKHPQAGMCGPKLMDSSGELRSVPDVPTPLKTMFNPIFSKWTSSRNRLFLNDDEPFVTQWIRGACMLIRKDVFDKVGGFDPRFFLYFEETDLCNSIKKCGFEIWIVGNSECRHINAASAKQSKAPLVFGDTIAEHYFRSRFYYFIKNYGWGRAVLAEAGEILALFIKALINLARGKSNNELKFRLKAPIFKLP
jgi:N-acetylglucosaminyl-diphospho-decaprenol L-rhamnosyltransferase